MDAKQVKQNTSFPVYPLTKLFLGNPEIYCPSHEPTPPIRKLHPCDYTALTTPSGSGHSGLYTIVPIGHDISLFPPKGSSAFRRPPASLSPTLPALRTVSLTLHFRHLSASCPACQQSRAQYSDGPSRPSDLLGGSNKPGAKRTSMPRRRPSWRRRIRARAIRSAWVHR